MACEKPNFRARYTPKNVVKNVNPALKKNDVMSGVRSRSDAKPFTTFCAAVPRLIRLLGSLCRIVSGNRDSTSAQLMTQRIAANQNGVVAWNHPGVWNSP